MEKRTLKRDKRGRKKRKSGIMVEKSKEKLEIKTKENKHRDDDI